ncbi:MAG TPA: bifunctional diaminohydroxyphosphoribosylaminopyrimidine deaminase/5-amino-6-(5-phosphoribosylamino)uracil reductase RibD [Abditibacteriaceae bacterium]|nr:bifunctional diaminohydroxyphosphoribosylaminopyrimidine deaminase/5-amino-6-(5-phosphoribosylamino)uracil reductase RibD [Abditibacteriaceae bacterium]
MSAPGRQEYSDDERWMHLALEWSRRGRGWTSPRPSVGCVIVRAGRVIGAGHTTPGNGNPHAEMVALQAATAAGEDTKGATCYVTLEPCCHYATTPPCTDALIHAGIGRVVSGVIDPNPAVNGLGWEKLRAAGIEVVARFMEAECRRAHDDFLKHIVARAPFVTLKCAVTLDGKIATRSGDSRWISGEASRRQVHRLRHEHDAVLIGIGTALADDPELTVRLEGRWKQPARVVVDSHGRLPPCAKLLRDAATRAVLIAATDAIPEARRAALEAAGARVLRVPARDDRVDLAVLCAQLYERGICSILIEGGARVAGAALEAGLVDKVIFFIAPILVGEGVAVLDGTGVDRLADAHRLRDVQVERVGDDVKISGYLR